uniref:tRNA(Ile)-lysidine synthase n=1 Tax=Sahlingia subintegra TaxID=468936 RepID=UPI001FCD6AB5|nr:tRNA(Ile)-lysidine synthase [Sahlingia subintegra]UNJ17412.1 tRNA(Ile)-lysidine synthase [Sahlingia subintegra]
MKKNKSIVHQKFNDFLIKNKLFKNNSSILLAVSGGQDSICLLKLLKDYQLDHNLEIHVIHFDHKWRKDSIRNCIFVKNISNRWSFIFHQKKAKTILSEEDARRWRYSTMNKLCKQLKITYILTGHTYNDKLESILFNMVKGSGFEGINTIQPFMQISQKLYIIRPLLNITREETFWFCRKFYLPIWSDFTNYNREIKRNRIREELMPYYKQYFNISLENSLSNFFNNINCDLNYLQERTYYLYYKYKHPKYIGINKAIFTSISLSMKKRLIRTFIYHNTNIKLNFIETTQYISLVESPNIKIKPISFFWHLYISRNWIYLLSNQKAKK